MPHPDRAQEARPLRVDAVLEQLHRAVERPRDEARVPVDEGTAVREAVEHGERVVRPQGQDEDGAVLPREGLRRGRGPVVAAEAQGEVRRLDHHQDEGREHGEAPPAGEGEAGEDREGEGRDEGEARERAHPAHEDDVLVEEAVEGGVGAEREHDRHDGGGDGHRAVPPRGGGEPRDPQREGGEPREERVAHVLRVEEPLGERPPRRGARRGVRGERRGVDRHLVERELLALEAAHPQVRRDRRREDRCGEEEARGEPQEVSSPQAAEERHRHRDREGGRGDRPEVDGGEPLQREGEAHDERPPERAALPEAVEEEEGHGQEDGDLRVQVRQARPAVGAGGEVRPGDERGEPVAARPPHEELGGEAGEQQRAEERDVVGEDGAEGRLQGRDQGGGQQQVLGEGERVRKRVERGSLEHARGLGPQRGARPREDPSVEAAVGAVHGPRADEVARERPAHRGEQDGVAEDRERDLAPGHTTGRGGAAGRLPGHGPREEPDERGQREGQQVGERPGPARTRLAEEPRRDDLAAPPGARPAEAQARPGAAVLEGHLERGRSLGEGDLGRGAQCLALAAEHHVAVERDEDAPPPLGPQLPAAGRGQAQLARPSRLEPPARGELPQVAPEEVDRAGRGPPDRLSRRGDLRGKPRRPAQGDDRGERGGDDDERDGERPPGPRAPLAAAERGEHGEGHRGQREGQGADVEGWGGVDRRPSGRGEGDERQRDGEAEAGGEGQETHQARHSTAVDRLPGPSP